MKQLLYILCFAFCLPCAAQQTEFVDFKKADVEVWIDIEDSKIRGSVVYDFEVIKSVDSFYVDAKTMDFNEVYIDGQHVDYKARDGKLWMVSQLKPNNYKLTIAYEAQPKKALYFVERNGSKQVWTQGQGKYTSNWLPSLDDMNEKIEFDLTINCSKGYEVVANGKLVKKAVADHFNGNTWKFDMNNAMPSYLVAFVVGKYNRRVERSKSGIPLEMYYYPDNEDKFEPTYRHTKQMFDYLEDEIGVPYPWQNYKQIPVHDFLYAGMENTGATIFSDDFLIDEMAFVDRNYVNINAHELAHQWFGNLVTAKSGTHHWLQEGFATYYALLVEKKVFGDNYFYWKLYESAQQLAQQDKVGQGTSLLNPKSSSLTFYQKGAWAIYMLRELIGDVAFKNTIKRYLNAFAFTNANTDNFFKIAEEEGEQDLSAFVNVWFNDAEFPIDRAMDALKHNSVFISEYLMVDCDVATSKCKDYLVSGISDEAKIKIIQQNPKLVTKDVFKNSLKVRQAISQYVTEIPKDLKKEFESLLKDKSYVTIESALYNLWVNFPEDRSKYLHATKEIKGFNDFNVRLLWLVLHLNTPEYQTDAKKVILEELLNYTSETYNAQVRMTAFSYLNMMKACNDLCKDNLIKAKTHHNWQLTKFAKNLLNKL